MEGVATGRRRPRKARRRGNSNTNEREEIAPADSATNQEVISNESNDVQGVVLPGVVEPARPAPPAQLCIAILTLLLVMLLCMISVLVTLYNIDALTKPSILDVRTSIWSSSSLVDLVNERTPVVLENTPFDDWPCMQWTLDNLENHVDPHTELLIKASRDPVFKYSATDKPFVGTNPLYAKNVVVHGDLIMVAKQFVQELRNMSTTRRRFLYASGDASKLGTPTQFGNTSELTFPTANETDTQVNFWFGHGGVTADWHYDTSENLHALIYGSKTFILRPPTAATELGLFPSIHHYYRQTEVSNSPSSSATHWHSDAHKVTLKPGQVLYIPAYWFHTVENTVTSLSVNAWSYSESFLIMEKIYELPIALEDSWSLCKQLHGASVFVDALLRSTLPNPEEAEMFLQRTLARRYKALYKAPANGNAVVGDLETCAWEAREQSRISPSTLDLFKSDIESRVGEHSELFTSMPLAVRRINIGNFIEHLYAQLLGDKVNYLPVLLGLRWHLWMPTIDRMPERHLLAWGGHPLDDHGSVYPVHQHETEAARSVYQYSTGAGTTPSGWTLKAMLLCQLPLLPGRLF